MSAFTPSQLRAIEATNKSMVLMASAGSGKTSVLVAHYNKLVSDHNIAPGQILTFTFTIKAAAEIKKRLTQSGALSLLDQALAPIGTLHAFMMNVLKIHGHRISLNPEFEILSEAKALLLKNSFIKKWLLDSLKKQNNTLEKAVSEWGFNEILKLFYKLSDDAHLRLNPDIEDLSGLIDLLNACHRDFFNHKIKLGTLDFSDLEIATLELLEKHPEVLRHLQNKYRHILVDEFQDINPIQGKLITQLYKPGVNRLLIVGDAKQSIYRFRRADVKVFYQVADLILAQGGELTELKETFRLAPLLAEKINKLFKPLFEAEPGHQYQELKSQRNDLPGQLHIVIAPTSGEKMNTIREAEALTIATALEIYKNNPDELKESAILLRSTTQIGIYAKALMAKNIPFRISKTNSLFKEQVFLDLLHLLNYFAGFTDALTLTGILRSPLFDFSEIFIENFIKNKPADFTNGHITDLFSNPLDQNKWEDFSNSLIKWKHLSKTLSPHDLFLELINDLGFFGKTLAYLPGFQHSIYQQPHLKNHVEQFLELIADIPPNTTQAYVYFQKQFRDLINENKNIEAYETLGNEKAVSLMTIHASKGLEFKRVFLPELHARTRNRGDLFILDSENGLVSKKEDTSQIKGLKKSFLELEPFRLVKEKEQNEESGEMKRLLYVAMTRAKDELTLFVKTPKKASQEEAASWNGWIWHHLKEEWQNGHELDRSPLREPKFDSLAHRLNEKFFQHQENDSINQPQSSGVIEAQSWPPSGSFVTWPNPVYSITALEAFHRCGKLYELSHIKNIRPITDGNDAHHAHHLMTASQWGTLLHEVFQYINFATLDNIQTVIEQALTNQGLTDLDQGIYQAIQKTIDDLLSNKSINLILTKGVQVETEKEF
ncbi:MAG: UvrD/REP helicase, partial [uncultured bacterium]